MHLGLDVGGTHTDAVLIEKGKLVASYKAVTNHEDLLSSVTSALDEVTKKSTKNKIERISLSTTLSTNAIVENILEEVGVIVSSGPGIAPENFGIGRFYVIDGSIDHRGTEIKKLDEQELKAAVTDLGKRNVKVFAAVTKFSTRNPDQESLIAGNLSGIADFTSQGHAISGILSFPRRIATAYFNSAVWRLHNRFADAIGEGIKKIGLGAGIFILKADGGTMPLARSRLMPVESILSGPAASIMGIIALCDISDDSIILDIGGTTTDIAIFASGAPLIEKDGIPLASRPTLVRALKTRSIGIGGDSELRIENGKVLAGPARKGPSMADGGSVPTLIDALNVSGAISYRNKENSLKGMQALAGRNNSDAKSIAAEAVEYAVGRIKGEVDAMILEINEKPVYTIHEMLEGKKITPKMVYVMGGPAKAMEKLLSSRFQLDVIVPKNYDVANAIGAALAKTTHEIELFADTGKGVMLIPNIGIREKVTQKYSLEDAEKQAKKYFTDFMAKTGITLADRDAEITESSSFKMVSGFYSSGRDIRVKCQVKPGVMEKIR